MVMAEQTRFLQRFCFSFIAKSIDEWSPFAGLEESAAELKGRVALLSLLVSLGFFLLYFPILIVLGISLEFSVLLALAFVLFLVVFVLTQWLFSLWLYYRVENRRHEVEKILPDFLLLVSSNIRAGSTPFASFRLSALPQFGLLSREVGFATAKSLGNQSFERALSDIASRVKSRLLNESVALFSQSMKQGSNLSRLLETIAFDVRRSQELQQEMLASTRMYVMFVGFIAVVATPVLMAISVQFLRIVQSIQNQSLEQGSTGVLSLSLSITPDFLLQASAVLLIGNALLASLLLGILQGGHARLGLKYFPVLAVASLALLVVFLNALSGLFASFI